MSAFGGQTPTLGGRSSEEEERLKRENRTLALSQSARETFLGGRSGIGPVLAPTPEDSLRDQLIDLRDRRLEAQEQTDLSPEQLKRQAQGRFERRTIALSQSARRTLLSGRTGLGPILSRGERARAAAAARGPKRA